VTIIGVIDLLHGRAVHAVAGDRRNYQPIAGGDAVALATGYFSHHQVSALYVADLDAIERRTPNDAIVRSLVALGHPVWLDAGITTVAQATHALALGVTTVVVGLETLTSFEALREVCDAVGGKRVAFSLDLRNGEPIIVGTLVKRSTPEQLAAHAVDAGAGTVIVIDLARVGTSAGIDLALLSRIRTAAKGVHLVAGGGVRNLDDLVELDRTGAGSVLIGAALRATAAK
jgi:phosphoribosylformimino-5-aminoimidazole carboxamide ribotide isomerase